MSGNALLIVQFVFTAIWRLFTSWHIPGTNVSPAAMAFLVLASSFILRWIKKYFLGGDD